MGWNGIKSSVHEKKTFMHNEISRDFEGFWMNLGSASNEIPTEHRGMTKKTHRSRQRSPLSSADWNHFL